MKTTTTFPFNPFEDLRAIRTLHAEGRIPMPLRRLLDLCRTHEFPGVKIANTWFTTEDALQWYLESLEDK